jgi:predicted lysophospholipase L1 biosynthesis ABC-type transport system permease subunit
MDFFIDLFLEFLALLLGLVGMVAGFAGALFGLVAAILTYVDISSFTAFELPSSLHWSYGIVILLVGILLMALSSVMRKKIGNPRR